MRPVSIFPFVANSREARLFRPVGIISKLFSRYIKHHASSRLDTRRAKEQVQVKEKKTKQNKKNNSVTDPRTQPPVSWLRATSPADLRVVVIAPVKCAEASYAKRLYEHCCTGCSDKENPKKSSPSSYKKRSWFNHRSNAIRKQDDDADN